MNNKIFEIRTMINNDIISIEDYVQSAYLYFTEPNLVNEPDEIKWGLLSLIEYVDDISEMTEKYELEYEKLLNERVMLENRQENNIGLIMLEMNLRFHLDKIKKCGEDAYQCYIDSNYDEKSRLLDNLLQAPESIDMIDKILDRIESIYVSEMEGYCYE